MPFGVLKRSVSHAETDRFRSQNRPFRKPKWTILNCSKDFSEFRFTPSTPFTPPTATKKVAETDCQQFLQLS